MVMNVIKAETIIKNFNKKGQRFYFWWSNNDERIIPVEIVSCPKHIDESKPYCYNVGIAFENINYISVPAHTLYNSRRELIEDRIKQIEEVEMRYIDKSNSDRCWCESQIKELKKML
jgi:hypothetical protein